MIKSIHSGKKEKALAKRVKPIPHEGSGKRVKSISHSSSSITRYRELLQRCKPTFVDSKEGRKFAGHVAVKQCEHEWKDNTAGWFDSKEKSVLKCSKCLKLRDEVQKTDELLAQLCKEADLLREALRTTFGTRSVLFKLVYEWAEDSKASGAQYPVHRIRPSDTSEFSTLANLFDEYRCHAAETKFVMNVTNTSVAVTLASCAYDPQSAGAYSSLGEPLIAMKSIGPVSCVGAATAPLSMNREGHYALKVTMPPGPQYEYGAVTSVATGTWTDTGITAVDYGYFKFAVTTAGTGTTYLRAVDLHWVEFRCRT